MYTNFAYIYDKLTYDIDYSGWADYIEKLFGRYGTSPDVVVDLGCGTGSFCIEMAKRDYEMIGIDISADMLACARNKAEQENADVLWLNQDMTNFELYGTVDAVVCLLDSLNYITRKSDLNRMFKLVNNYLNHGGLFIFDVNTPFKFENELADNVFYEIGDDLTYIWENKYDKSKKICTFDLSFFIRSGECYIRHDEVHTERSYSNEELIYMVEKSGLKLLKVFGDLTFNPSNKRSKRAFYVCTKD